MAMSFGPVLCMSQNELQSGLDRRGNVNTVEEALVDLELCLSEAVPKGLSSWRGCELGVEAYSERPDVDASSRREHSRDIGGL